MTQISSSSGHLSSITQFHKIDLFMVYLQNEPRYEKTGFLHMQKQRLMTGTYILQSNRAKFNQYSVNPTCLLCGEDPEDLEHFLLKCRALTVTRDPFMEKTICLLNDYLGTREQQNITRDLNFLVSVSVSVR